MEKKKRRTEISAGGLIVCRKQNTWWILVMKDHGNNWTFPKGKMEEGEDHINTATREIEEEVGISGLMMLTKLTPSKYWYFREGSIHKTVHYFLFEAKEMTDPVVQTEEGITEAKWIPFEDVAKLIGYPKTNTPLLKEAEAFLYK